MSDMSNIKKALSMVQVYDVPMTKIRIGNQHDGGYVALKELCDKTSTVYSFGVGNDVGFELEWINLYPNSKIQLFDPFIDKPPIEHKRFTLHKLGLGLKYKPIKDVASNSLLKMDIEGDEWGAFQIFDEKEVRKFNQLLVEFHWIHVEPPNNLSPYFYQIYNEYTAKINEDLFANYHNVLQWLSNWFIIFHIHANNSLPVVCVDGYWFPPLLEISFVRRDLVGKSVKKYLGHFPVAGIDLPNKTNRPDIFDYYPMVTNGKG